MLVALDQKKRCVLFHGTPNSGKTWIARYMHNIFESHWLQQTKEIYAQHMTEADTRRQLLIINEANMSELFSKRNMPYTKQLTEGLGWPVAIKYSHGFTGFVGSHQLVTCNALVCPLK